MILVENSQSSKLMELIIQDTAEDSMLLYYLEAMAMLLAQAVSTHAAVDMKLIA